MITPNDLRNPKRKSGYTGVGFSNGGSTRKKPYFANWREGDRVVKLSRRATSLEAAQDYCDHINGQPGSAPAALASHGHVRTRTERTTDRTQRELDALKVLREEAAKRKTEKGNFVYLVGMIDNPQWVKIGEAYDPENRYIGGQTFNPYTLTLLGYEKADRARDADKALHRKFVQHHHKAEWFRPADAILAYFNITRTEFLRRCGGTTLKEVKAA